MITSKEISVLKQYSDLRDIDLHFADFVSRLDSEGSRALYLAAALASKATGEKNICLDLSQVEKKPLTGDNYVGEKYFYPDLKSWREALQLCSVVGKPGDPAPLIMDSKDRLYLYRYYEYEKKLSDEIKRRLTIDVNSEFIDRIKEKAISTFEIDPSKPDLQAVAAVTAALRNISVISGGPGTGKTTTIIKILELIISISNNCPKIFLAAPTGKAANRLMESVRKGLVLSACCDDVKACFPEDACTIHRLLGTKHKTPYFRHNEENPLRADVVVIDEASMVDMALMSKLFSAIPEKSKIILVGDKDQLSSVESGSVLGDICDRQHSHSFSKSFCNTIKKITGYDLKPDNKTVSAPQLSDNIVILDRIYRFTTDSGIGELGKYVNAGDVSAVLNMLKDPSYKDIEFKSLSSPQHLRELVIEKTLKYFNLNMSDDNGYEQYFNLFEQFKFLCALKNGLFGVHTINDFVENILSKKGLLSFSENNTFEKWYAGKPVMIKSNDYSLGLFNGDVGIVTKHCVNQEQDELVARFQNGPDQKIRQLPLYQLPDHDTAYAMTIHKSQGSEFDDVVIILPEKDTPFLTRELIYTAMTRSRKSVTIWGNEEVLSGAVSRTIQRTSGLRDALWDNV